MRHFSISLVVLGFLFWCGLQTATARSQCDDSGQPNAGKTLGREDLQAIIDEHEVWLRTAQLPPPRSEVLYYPPLKTFTDERDAAKLRDQLRNHGRANFACARISYGMEGFDLRYASFADATIEARFVSVNLEGASFYGATLKGASFVRSNLKAASFTSARFVHSVDFEKSDLTQAWFEFAKLSGATFTDSVLTDAEFARADLAGANFNSRLQNLPLSLRFADNLHLLSYTDHPDSLYALRESFRKVGRRNLEREVTFALESARTEEALNGGAVLEGVARYLAFEWPTAYDMEPTRALMIVALLVLGFAVPYGVALSQPADPKIWRVLPPDRLNGDGKQVFEALRPDGWERVKYALLFSVFSAFQLGWRDLNVGTWLSRLQGNEYAMRGKGWVRTLSGIQSLISLYLVAMWALTQFGRLFDG